jgi:hypothetical protein
MSEVRLHILNCRTSILDISHTYLVLDVQGIAASNLGTRCTRIGKVARLYREVLHNLVEAIIDLCRCP